MSHVSKVKVSPSLCRRLGALEDAHGMGHDERARAWPIEVLSRVVDGSMSVATAASVLVVSTRHIRRLIMGTKTRAPHRLH